MTQDYHKESVSKIPLPSCPNEENYVTPKEFNNAMAEYHDNWAVVHVTHECWVRWEQVKDA